MRMKDIPKMMLIVFLCVVVNCEVLRFEAVHVYVRYFSFVSFMYLLVTSIKTVEFLVSKTVLLM